MLGVITNLRQKSINKINYNIPKVDIYVLTDCPWSERAIKLLDYYQIKYNYLVITNDQEFKQISNKTSINTFPQIFINNEFIGGYSELEALLTNDNLLKLIQ